MSEPWTWRIVRACAASLAFGFVVLSGIAVLTSIAQDAGARDWSLGKPETISWTFAVLAFPAFLLTPLPASSWWGFVRALSPPLLLLQIMNLGAKVSDAYHRSDPAWIDWALVAIVYLGFVPWASWRTLVRTIRREASRSGTSA